MISTTSLLIQSQWNTDRFFLWANKPSGHFIDPMELKWLLFAWHRPSYFGHFIESAKIGRMKGIELPSEAALDFFCDPACNDSLEIEWSEELAELRRWAPLLKSAIEQDRLMPDFARLKQGDPGWKLAPAGDAALTAERQDGDDSAFTAGRRDEETIDFNRMKARLPYLDQWIGRLLESKQPHHAEFFRKSAFFDNAGGASGDPARSNALSIDLWEDEDDWLAAIGWREDPVPFRSCLQLLEPEDDVEPWQLKVVLQGRAEPARIHPADGEGNPLDADFPAEWRAFLPRARSDIRRWTLLVPWLSQEQAEPAESAEPVEPAESAQSAEPAELAESAESAKSAELAGPAQPAQSAQFVQSDQSAQSAQSAQPAAARSGPEGSARPTRIRSRLTTDEAWRFLSAASLKLAEFGYSLFLPAWWQNIHQLKPKLKAKMKSSVGSNAASLFGLEQIMQYDWRLALGDVELSEQEFQQLALSQKHLAHIRGRWIRFDPAMLQQVQNKIRQMEKKRDLNFREVMSLHLTEGHTEEDAGDETNPEAALRIEVELDEQLQFFMNQLRRISAVPWIDPPAGFRGLLRKYQIEGSSWLLFLRKFGFGACLADDMGLGKTIQYITYLLAIRESGGNRAPSLLICPTSVLGNWQKELERFSPSLKIHLHYGANREKDADAFGRTVREADLVMTSYTLARLDEEIFSSLKWCSICLDEAQNIKNAYTKQSGSIRRLEADHMIAMTGTPIENRLTELWSIFDFINPGYLGSLRQFAQRFVHPIERHGDREPMEQVQRLVQPFLLRRTKTDPRIELDLPEKIESKTYVSLTKEQAALYENVIQSLAERIDRLDGMERKGLILASLTRLKQICDHPGLYLKDASHAQADHAGAAAADWERSNKIIRLLEMVGELREKGDRCLIFTQYVEMGHMLQAILTRQLEPAVQFLHGGTPKSQRDLFISRFQNTEPGPEPQHGIFILSLKAGGVGLNLTAANHVFHFDRWWNPAVENQATDRAFRIGQNKRVQVHKFVTLGTLEERIDEMIEQKQGLSQQIIGGGEGWITELSSEELLQLFQLRHDWPDS